MGVADTYLIRPAAGFPGTVLRVDLEADAKNAEASAEIAFGKGVVLDTVNTFNGAKLPAASNNTVWGIAMRGHYLGTPEQYGSVGVKAGENFKVLRKGRILVTAGDALARGARGHVRCVVGTGNQTVGAIGAADSTNTIDTSQQVSIEQAVASGDLVEVEVDFTREQG